MMYSASIRILIYNLTYIKSIAFVIEYVHKINMVGLC